MKSIINNYSVWLALVLVLLIANSSASTASADENTGHMGILLSYSLNCKLMSPSGELRFDRRMALSGMNQETMFDDKDFRDLYLISGKVGCDFMSDIIENTPEFMLYFEINLIY
jgi:hypothetical protein